MSEKLIRVYKCNSKAHNSNSRFEDKISANDVLSILEKFSFKCFYCQDEIKTNWQLDHFHPRANGGKNTIDNLVPCCKWCNTMKNALEGVAFINKCKNILENNWFSKNGIELNLSNKIETKDNRKKNNKLKTL